MAKKQAAAVPVSDLVRMALLNVANANGDIKLSGKGGVFSSAAGANKEAIDECLSAANPLLTILRTEGKSQFVALAPAGFERISRELDEGKVGPLAKAIAATIPLGSRAEFIQSVIGRTPIAAAELLPVLEEAVAAEKAEQAARLEAATKRREAEQAARVALERALAVFDERRHNRLEALRREYEIEGGKASELPDPAPKAEPLHAEKVTRHEPASQKPTTDEEKDFRRNATDRLAAAWRDEFDAEHAEGCNALETAIWNIRGMKMIGEPGQQVQFQPRLHECKAPAPNGAPMRVVRPGWQLKIDDEDYVALKAVVEAL